MRTHYDTLKIATDAPAEVIRAAYRALAQRYHPDRNPGDVGAAQTMQALNDAYAVLSDPARRDEYDASIARRTVVVPGGAGRAQAARAHAAYRAVATPDAPATSRRARRRPLWQPALAVIGLCAAIGVGAGLAIDRNEPPVAPALAPASPGEWGMRTATTPAAVGAPHAPDAAPAAPRTLRGTRPAPPLEWTLPPPSAGTRNGAAGAPIVADPNGRPWPFQRGYVAGLPQGHADGLTTVTADNRGNAWPVFLKLVSLDGAAPQAVRHVYLPAQSAFMIDRVRPGRYELQYQNLVTGELTRSGAFELRQIEGRYDVRYSELEITLYDVPGGTLGREAIAPVVF